MFKIVENTNGTTSIFCNQSGQLVCTVHSRKSSLVGVSRPIQKTEGTANSSPNRSLKAVHTDARKQDQYHSHFAEDDTVSCASYNSSDSEEPSDDCIDQYAFFQSFDLICKREICTKPINELKSTFPRRKISQIGNKLTKHVHVRKENIFENTKLFDEVELCSPLGHLALDSSRRYLDEREVSAAIKKYEKYCQFSALSVHPNPIHLPQLRCRDNLKYPVTFRPTKFFKSYWTHRYTFGHRQRDNHYRTLVTGLNERSRRLKRLCRKMHITLYRLPKSDIRLHSIQYNDAGQSVQRKRTTVREKSVAKCSALRSVEQTRNPEPLNSHSDPNSSCSFYKKLQCAIKVENVLKSLLLIENKVYVKGTNITVPEHYILELAIKKPPNILRMKKVNCIKNNSRTVEWVRLQNTSVLEPSQTVKENTLPNLEEIQNILPYLTKRNSETTSELNHQVHLEDCESKESLSGRKRRFACTLSCCKNTSDKKTKHDNDYIFYDEGTSVLFHSRKRCQQKGVDFTGDVNTETKINGLAGSCSPEQLSSVENDDYQCKVLTASGRLPQNEGMLKKLLSCNTATEHIPLQQKYKFLNESNHCTTEPMSSMCYENQQNISTNIFRLKTKCNIRPVVTNKAEVTVTPYCPSWTSTNLGDVSTLSVKRNRPKVTQHEQETIDVSASSGNNTDVFPGLTLDTNNDRPKTFMSSYIFKCHGCGFKASFQSSREKLHKANHHMTSYHSVKEPNTFLSHTSVIHDNHVEIITEGFPSYKASNFSEL